MSEDFRIVRSHITKDSKPRPTDTEHKNQSPPPSESPPSKTSPSRTMFCDFLLNHPSTIEKPIDSYSLPNLFQIQKVHAYSSNDMIKYPLSSTELEIFMTGQPFHQQNHPTHDTTAVEHAIGYMFHVLIDFSAHRPHDVASEKEDRANLVITLNIIFRALLHTKQVPDN